MKILLLAVGLTLVCGLQAVNNNAEDSPKVTGKWFTVALASNVTSKIEEGGSLQIFVESISENDGIIYGYFFKRGNGKCTPFSVTVFTVEGGQMFVQYDGDNYFTIQSIDYEHLILILYNTKDGEVTVWGELFGRTADLSDEIKKKFEEICERFGIRKDQIRDLSKDDRCQELR
ncbi:major urinary protein-like [Trichosurus vulpecula]|uniref:major urinary protein-like n=1 Tax=Trichosurus vulpecula TaxID=9337 RepID=UPI00186B3403|nr:major urinary protein-like [Trichosurus vulpecula]